MKKIEIIKYYIFVDNSEVKLGKYDTLEELSRNAKEYIDNSDLKIGKSKAYIGVEQNFGF